MVSDTLVKQSGENLFSPHCKIKIKFKDHLARTIKIC